MEHIHTIVGPYMLAEKMDKLKRKFELLEAKKDDIEEELRYETESSYQKRPRKEVENWITNVRRAKPQVEELERRVSETGFLKRLSLEVKVESLTREVEELKEQSRFERGLTLETHDNKGVAFLTKTLIGEAFEQNKKSILYSVLLGEDSIVGVYGMGGVGKTTLLMHIHNELLLRPNINVFWVTVSQNPNIHKLQDDIAKAVCIDISVEDEIRKRAAKLANALKRRENLILILDDVWENISLMDVGICVGENVWKLVLTTRSLTVCRMLKCGRLIKVEPLSDGEAWTLFTETLHDDDLLSDDQITRIAGSLVRECDGLPLGIAVMAGSMRGVDEIHEWSNALKDIREAKYECDDMEFYDRVFLVLKYSYDRLKDLIVKECLLYCCLCPEDWVMDRYELIDYLIDNNLIDGSNGRASAFEKGHTILNKLENVCLLMEARGGVSRKARKVKLHDLVRDMAIRIASDGPFRFWVQTGLGLKEFPHGKMWSKDLLRVSLADNKISYIPSNASPKCPRLKTLILGYNRNLRGVPDKFFVHMKKLTVLNLSYTEIESLPSSITKLKSLTALLLGCCRMLKHIPSLENLTALRRLDLFGTSIDELPGGMEKLINLKHLDLRECTNFKTIPQGILPQLSQLEWFNSGFPLCLRGVDIGSLKKLETFLGEFNNMSELATCLMAWGERRPKNYAISVGHSDNEVDDYSDLDKRMRVLYTDDHTFVFPSDTQSLEVTSCSGVTSLIRSNSVGLMQSLEKLELRDLPKLTRIVERDTVNSDSNTFSSLKILKIITCCGLERLFGPSSLESLEELVVKDCTELVEIAIDTVFPNLKLLDLDRLPKLERFCNGSLKLLTSLERIRITKCPEMKRLTLLWDEPNTPISLKQISVERDWWDSAEWRYPQTKDALIPFVRFCD